MTNILDTNHDVTHRLEALKAAGIKIVIRYVSTNTAGEKCIKAAEAKAIAAAGLRLGLVFEVYGGTKGELNASLGAIHGAFAGEWLPKIGAPDGAAIYFAVDSDPNPSQITASVIPYLKAAKSAMGSRYRTGVYGPGSICSAAQDAGIADLTWLSNAMGWRGSKAYRDSKKWNILQHLPQNIAGIDTDPDEINPARSDIGDFIPFAGLAAPAANPANPTGAVAAPPPNPGTGSDILPGEVNVKVLNLRAKADATSKIIGKLEIGTPVRVYGSVMNGPTKWLDLGNGFVAARYVNVAGE